MHHKLSKDYAAFSKISGFHDLRQWPQVTGVIKLGNNVAMVIRILKDINRTSVLPDPPEVRLIKAEKDAQEDLTNNAVSHHDNILTLVSRKNLLESSEGAGADISKSFPLLKANLMGGSQPEVIKFGILFLDLFVRASLPNAVVKINKALLDNHFMTMRLSDETSSLYSPAQGTGVNGGNWEWLESSSSFPGLLKTVLIQRDVSAPPKDLMSVPPCFSVPDQKQPH
jgi:hypothetical protein